MKVQLILTILLIGSFISCKTSNSIKQSWDFSYTKDELTELIEKKFNVDTDSLTVCDFFIVEGVPVEFEKEIKENANRTLQLETIKISKMNREFFPNSNCDLIIFLERNQH